LSAPRSAFGAPRFLALAATLVLAPSVFAASPADAYLYIPPWMADHVVFYHSFEQGPDKPEINLLGAKVQAVKPAADEAPADPAGLTGRCFAGSLHLREAAIPLGRPITVSLWWRLREALKPDGGFGLIGLNAKAGYISNFVRSGPWCGLKEPHAVIQCYSFPGVSNVNGIYGSALATEPGVWHHAAMVVAGGSQVTVYWDGAVRGTFYVNGRALGEKDLVQSIGLGQEGATRPMAIDEVLILDGALTAGEIREYVTAARGLAAMRFPAVAPKP
jgi:hypothetical protein